MGFFSELGKIFLPGELPGDAGPYVVPLFPEEGTCYLPGRHRAEEAAMIARWLVRLRWAAICGFLVLAACFRIFFRTVMPTGALYALCVVILLYNFGFFLLFKSQKSHDYQTALFSIRLQVFLDWLALLLFIHFTGGIFSPLMFFVILHVIINAMIFTPRQCYLYTVLLLLGLAGLVLVEYVVRIFPVNNLWLGANPPTLEPLPMLIAFLLFSFVLFGATFLATSIMGRFRQRENEVRRLTASLQKALTRMETLYEATTAMVASYDLTAVLDLIVRDSVRIMGAKGAAVHLLQEGGQEMSFAAACGLSDAYLHKGPITAEDGLTPKRPDEVIIVEDTEHDPRIKYPRESQQEGIRSIISIPLVSKGKIRGDLRLYASSTHHFDPDEIAFLKILAGGAAVIIDNVRAWKALEESNRRIISFAYKIGHDLKSPVGAVQSLLSAMQDGFAGEVPPKQKDILARCIKKQDQLLQLIRDLLSLAEGQLSTDGQKMAPIDLAAAAAEAVNLLEAVSQAKGVVIRYTAPRQPLLFQEVLGDFQRLFGNLLDNAIRYTPAGGNVELTLAGADNTIVLTVRDTGIGIEPEFKDKIFEEFYRTPQAKRVQTDGTGLGLAIVRGIVQRYNGTISVESEPGKGTAFSIVLPLK